jgi:hypothetical protein
MNTGQEPMGSSQFERWKKERERVPWTCISLQPSSLSPAIALCTQNTVSSGVIVALRLLSSMNTRRCRFRPDTTSADRCNQEVVFELLLRVGVALTWDKFHHQGILHGEHGIIVKILAILVEDLCCDGFVTVFQYLDLCQYSYHSPNSEDLQSNEYVQVGMGGGPKARAAFQQVHHTE